MEKFSQFELYNAIINVANINVVTCGMCGLVVLHPVDAEEITCPSCKFEGEPCDFPDYIWDDSTGDGPHCMTEKF